MEEGTRCHRKSPWRRTVYISRALVRESAGDKKYDGLSRASARRGGEGAAVLTARPREDCKRGANRNATPGVLPGLDNVT